MTVSMFALEFSLKLFMNVEPGPVATFFKLFETPVLRVARDGNVVNHSTLAIWGKTGGEVDIRSSVYGSHFHSF
jgi:hypothetical protein